MKPDRIIIQVSPGIRKILDEKQEQGFSIAGYVRKLILKDNQRAKK